jgi:hypothetical protein
VTRDSKLTVGHSETLKSFHHHPSHLLILRENSFAVPLDSVRRIHTVGLSKFSRANKRSHSLLGFLNTDTSLTLKFHAPSTFLNNFLCAFHRTEYTASPLRFPFAHDRIGSAAFLLHEREGVCARGRQHRSLFSPERIDDHPSIFPFLNQFCPIGTAGQGDDEEDGEA